MQFRDLHRQYERLKPEMDAAIAGVLEDAHYISGPQVKALEESLAQYAGAKHCISCANGTDALSLILHAWGEFLPTFPPWLRPACPFHRLQAKVRLWLPSCR